MASKPLPLARGETPASDETTFVCVPCNPGLRNFFTGFELFLNCFSQFFWVYKLRVARLSKNQKNTPPPEVLTPALFPNSKVVTL
jgi:hypothetical protein